MRIGQKVAELDTWGSNPDIDITSDHGSFRTIEEAEEKAFEVADSEYEDAVIVEENGEFHVYGVEEIRDEFRGGWSDNTLEGAANGVYELVMTDSVDDETERIAGTTDGSTKIDEVSRAFRRAGLSGRDAYNIVKWGLDKESAQTVLAKLQKMANSNNLFKGTQIAQAQHLIRIINDFNIGDDEYISAAQIREAMDIGYATTGATIYD